MDQRTNNTNPQDETLKREQVQRQNRENGQDNPEQRNDKGQRPDGVKPSGDVNNTSK